ncbi:MAG: 4-(cytidine 5'-diphospho)-2-C-methyl-D-erythritol kinase [Chitinophagaceae bacterium]
MIIFPNCKINLGLRILRKRSDGYHDLETIFYPLPLYDIVEIVRSPGDNSALSFSTSGSLIDGNNDDNLCVKAYELLKRNYSTLPVAKIHLHKAIPTGAGMGGGSADASFTLKLLNEKFGLQLSTEQLIGHALQLGSDCPFFIINKPAFAGGRGEILKPVSLDLSAYKFIIVNPGIHINTANAFSTVTPALPSKSVKEIIQQSIDSWKNELINDFEKSVFLQYPEIEEIKSKLYDNGAVYASMSGSGSTVYGIFKKDAAADHHFPSHYFFKELNG